MPAQSQSMASGDLLITLCRVGSFRAGRHGDFDAQTSHVLDCSGCDCFRSVLASIDSAVHPRIPAGDVQSLTLSGSNVTSWTDRASGIVALQATGAKQPTWSATARNGKGGVTFNGTNSVLQLQSVASLPSAGNFSEIVLAAYAASGTSNQIAFSYGANAIYQVRAVGANGGFVDATEGAAVFSASETFNGNDRFIDWAYSSSVDTLRIDGGSLETGSLSTPATNMAGGFIGIYIDGSSAPFNGVIQQLIITNIALTITDRQKLEGWESWYDGKAGANLPIGHPYKSAPPLLNAT
jgi:hypothetical protein